MIEKGPFYYKKLHNDEFTKMNDFND